MLPQLELSPGETMRTIRERRGQTLEQAGELVGISAQHLSNIEKGRARPGLDVSVAISREFGIPVETWSTVQPEAVA